MIVMDIDLVPYGFFSRRSTLGRLTIVNVRRSRSRLIGDYEWVYTVSSSPDFPGGYVFMGKVKGHRRNQNVMALVSKVTRQIGKQIRDYEEAINGKKES